MCECTEREGSGDARVGGGGGAAAAGDGGEDGDNLSPDQLAVYDAVVARRESIFFTGAAGTGKTHLVRGADARVTAAASGLAYAGVCVCECGLSWRYAFRNAVPHGGMHSRMRSLMAVCIPVRARS